MKKILLTLTALAAFLQADVVHYDSDKDADQVQTSKPNHPSSDLYTK